MTDIASSPLPALIHHYKRLEATQSVADFGFSLQRVSFAVVINDDGTLFAIEDMRRESNGRIHAPRLSLPGHTMSSGGITERSVERKARFLWGDTRFLLAQPRKGAQPPDTEQKANWCHGAFRQRHLDAESAVADSAFSTVCRFLERPVELNEHQLALLAEVDDASGIFRLRNAKEYVHQRDAVKQYWIQHFIAETGENSEKTISLLTGQEDLIASIHLPAIKWPFREGQSDKKLVSFDAPAYRSYGKEQSLNAPVGVRDAFYYAEALNSLLARADRRLRLGDATVVFWADRDEAKDAEEIFQAFFVEQIPKVENAESTKLVDRLREFLKAARQGRLTDEFTAPEAHFYILGLSPGVSRIYVRFWITGTVAQFAQRLSKHVADLEIVGSPNNAPPPGIDSLLAETARKQADIPPQLAGEVTRAVLQGLPYPQALFHAVVRRIRADGAISWRRASILNACLNREGKYTVEVYLNKEHPAKAYHCGRLMAVLAFTQEQALGEVNSGVIRRNLGSVMATPGLMLGRLQRAAEVGHIPKLARDLAVFIRDELKSINVMLRDSIPIHLDLRQQGVFALGFYQQLQYLGFVGEQVKQNRRVRSSQGEWVRSRLEARVADALTKAGFAYIYETSAVLPDAGERWPDFVVRRAGQDRANDLYIEVLGMDTPDYNKRWEKKLAAYEKFGVTSTGGPRGRLLVLDFRNTAFDDKTVFDGLSPYMDLLDTRGTEEVQENNND